MARKEPELFYHPVVGTLSPTTLGMWNFQDLFKPNAQPPKPAPKSPSEAQAEAQAAIETSRQQQDVPKSSIAISKPANTVNQITRPIYPREQTRPQKIQNTTPPEPFHPITQELVIPERKTMKLSKTAVCAVTGEILSQNDMIRFVISPEGKVTPDLTGKLPGQFLWVAANRSALKKAIWRNSFAGLAKKTVEIPENLLETIESGLSRLAIQSLSMARRAGELTLGFTKTDEALRSGHTSVYVVASNASDNGREKLERLARHKDIPVIDEWTSAELSAVLGEENVNHISLKEGGLARTTLGLIEKLKAVRSEK